MIEDYGWRVITLNAPEGVRPGLVVRLASCLRRFGCDVVHTHDDRPMLYGGLAARLASVRRCLQQHHHRTLANATSRQKRLASWAARLVDPFVCVSHDAAHQVIAQGVPARCVQVVWNGIDLSRFSFHGPTHDGPAVIVARLSPEKDIANLLHAAAKVVRADPTFRLEIAGNGPCREDLLRLKSELHLDEHVCFLGEVRDVSALLARARLAVLSSRTEGISLTVLEAMASGLPVIATQVGGNSEVVEDGRTGLLVSARNPGALADAIRKVWNEPDALDAMGRAGRLRAETHFDVRAMVGRYEAIYEGKPGPAWAAAPVAMEVPCAL